jgi:dTDP-4-amino-4,6-dideoxygalactose transaminase
MSELCGSVALAQLDKLSSVVERRRLLAAQLDAQLADTPELITPVTAPDARHSYWKYCLRIADSLPADAVIEIAALLKECGVTTVPRYIQKPAFMCEVLQNRKTFGRSEYPFSLARPGAVDYRVERFPGTAAALERILVVPWNDRYSEEDVTFIAEALKWAIRSVCSRLQPA